MATENNTLDYNYLRREFHLNDDELAVLSLASLAPAIYPSLYLSLANKYNQVGGDNDFDNDIGLFLKDELMKSPTNLSSAVIFLKPDLRFLFLNSTSDEDFNKNVSDEIQRLEEVLRKGNTHIKPYLSYLRALQFQIGQTRENAFVNFSNGQIVNTLDQLILQYKDKKEHSELSRFIDKDDWEFLVGLLEFPYLKS